MPTIERKSKFEKNNSIYRRRKKHEKQIFEKYNFDIKFIDGLKIKPLTEKLINKLIIDKSVVEISGNNDLKYAIIISQNKDFLILSDFSDDKQFGELVTIFIKFIDSIIIKKNSMTNLIKFNYIIYNLQSQYFKNKTISKIPKEINKIIKSYINYNDYNKFSSLSKKKPKRIFLFIKNILKMPISIYVNHIEPELYCKILEVNDTSIKIKAVDLNLIFYTELININFEDIECFSIKTFNKNNKDKNIENYFNLNFDKDIFNQTLKKIHPNLFFFNNLNNCQIKDQYNTNYNVDYNFIKKINYLIENSEHITYINKNYKNNKNIVENINELVNLEKSLDYDNIINEIIDIEFNNGNFINDVIVLECNNNNLIVSEENSLFIIFKNNIKKIIKNYDNLKVNKTNYFINKKLEGRICWIETIYSGWCYFIEHVNDNNIIAYNVDKNCYKSDRKNILKIKDILYINFSDDYLDFLNLSYKKYRNDSVMNNYKQVYNDIIDLKKDYFDDKLGLNWDVYNFDVIPQVKLIYCSVSNKQKNLNFTFKLDSLYKIIPDSYEDEDDEEN
jgi:hypothetical protein